MTIDLRGLGPAIREQAKARKLPAAAVARQAVVAMLESSPVSVQDQAADSSKASDDQTVKLTVRMRRCIAGRLTMRARAAGLSQGAYLATLIEGAPAPPLPVDHREAIAALGVSTDQLAAVSADVCDFIRLFRSDSSPPVVQLGDRMRALTDVVRQHLVIASRLMADLKPATTARAHLSTGRFGGQRVSS